MAHMNGTSSAYLVVACTLCSLPIWAMGAVLGYRNNQRGGDIFYVYFFALVYCVIGVSILHTSGWAHRNTLETVRGVVYFSVINPAMCGIGAMMAKRWWYKHKPIDTSFSLASKSRPLASLIQGCAVFIVVRYSIVLILLGLAAQYGYDWQDLWWYKPLFVFLWFSSSPTAAALLGILIPYSLEQTVALAAVVSAFADIPFLIDGGIPALLLSPFLLSALVGSYPLGFYLRLRRVR